MTPKEKEPVLLKSLSPIKVNHGDAWGNGKNWFTFYCPNNDCKRQLTGESKCPYCNQSVVWKK